MMVLLSPFAKTVPSNYSIKGAEVLLGIAPGESCTDWQWEKARRQESEYYDWASYEACMVPKVDHPEYVKRSEDDKVFQHWEKILQQLEPLPRSI